MTKPLTTKQSRLLEFIESFITDHGYSPTIREMAAGLGYKGSSNVHSLLEQLVKKGYVSKISSGPRTIQVIKSLHSEQVEPNEEMLSLVEAVRNLHETLNTYWQGDCDKQIVIQAQSRLCDVISGYGDVFID